MVLTTSELAVAVAVASTSELAVAVARAPMHIRLQ